MGWFSFQRSEGFPTHYQEQHSPASIDVVLAGLILATIILGVSLLSLLPSYNGNRKWIFFVQVVVSLFIGGTILVVNFGQNWEVGAARITCPYMSGSSQEIKADLGIYIGLRGVNVTLSNAKTIPVRSSYLHGETGVDSESINYNEYFSWEGTQGRFGFGQYSAKVARDFREAIYRGLPIPILQLAEYFTFDGEGIRFGRHYRLAGWYSQILLWTALPCWIISCVLLRFVVRYGALFLMAAGLFQFLAILVWYFTRNFAELQVPFESGYREVILKTYFGRDFYLVLCNAVASSLLGFALLWLNALWPEQMCQSFGIDPLTIYDEYHLTNDELAKKEVERRFTEMDDNVVENGTEDTTTVIRQRSDDREGQLVLKRRTDAASRLFRKSLKLKPRVLPRLTRREIIKEEAEMGVRTPLLAGANDSELYESTPMTSQRTARRQYDRVAP